MKKTSPLVLLVACFCVAAPPGLHAMGGILKSPLLIISKPAKKGEPRGLSLRPSAASQTRLFESFDEAFISGHFVNWNSWLHFTGSAATLNKMLVELAKTDGVKYGVRFTARPIPARPPFASAASPGNLKAERARWTVHHDGQSNEIWITILTGKDGIELEELRLPTVVKSIP